MMKEYSVLKNGAVVRHGVCMEEDFEHQAIGEDEEVVEGHQPFPEHPEEKHWSLKRKEAYPKLEVFADAFYWFQQGDSSKMDAYLAKVEEVKSLIPKE